jgi:hypothetical protein
MRTPVAKPAPETQGGLLLDRHGKPADQPRNLIQMFGIMLFNGSREPKQAFVVTHGGNVAWDNRGYRAYQVGRSGWHRIRSHEPCIKEPPDRLSRIGGPRYDAWG